MFSIAHNLKYVQNTEVENFSKKFMNKKKGIFF